MQVNNCLHLFYCKGFKWVSLIFAPCKRIWPNSCNPLLKVVTFISKIANMKQQHVISRLAIYLLSIVMIVFGILHFAHPRDLVNYVPQFLPGGIIWVYFVGAAFLLVAIAFFTNTMVKAAGYLLAGLLIIFVLTIHLPNYMNAGDKEMRQVALISILKDTAIACFALYIGAGAHHQKLHMDQSD